MNDVDLDGLASDLGFVLKVEQKEDVESLLRGKLRMFLVCCLRAVEKARYFSCLFWQKKIACSSPNASVEW